MMIDVDGQGETKYHYHYDGRGSVTAITAATNNSLVEYYRYDVYGKVTMYDSSDSRIYSSTVDNPYYFTGRRLDPETDLYYYRARMYSFHLGRFLQPDPIGYAADLNLYRYCGNNPVNWVDPWGLAEVRSRPLDDWYLRWPANWLMGEGDMFSEHWQIFYDSGGNSGYFGNGKNAPAFRSDKPGLLGRYHNTVFPHIDDTFMKMAEKVVQNKWRAAYKRGGRRYHPIKNSCQTYTKEVVETAIDLERAVEQFTEKWCEKGWLDDYGIPNIEFGPVRH